MKKGTLWQIEEGKEDKLKEIHAAMKSLPGLSDAEVTAIESKYGFAFPSDLKCFLQAGIPPNFYNYHKFAEEGLAVGSAEDLITAAIKDNATPEDEEGKAKAKENPLIPLSGTRFMPSKPSGRSLPVISYSDGIGDRCQYGDNLFEYLEKDDHIAAGVIPEDWKPIPWNGVEADFENHWEGVPYWENFI